MRRIARTIATVATLVVVLTTSVAAQEVGSFGIFMFEDEEEIPKENGFSLFVGDGTAFFPKTLVDEMRSSDDGWNEDVATPVLEELKASTESYPNEILFTADDGEEFRFPNPGYGWTMDVGTTAERMRTVLEAGGNEASAAWLNGSERTGRNDVGDWYVEVDVSRQTVYLYANGEKVDEAPCVTGNADGSKDTPRGAYSIYSKLSPTTLRGYNPDGSLEYASDVTYWMPFNGGIGLHDASWRSEFGGDIYTWDGSHGCVNLPFEFAKEVYESTWIGYPVIVHE